MKKITSQKILTEYIKKTGAKKQDVATILGTNKFNISRWLNGRHEPLPIYQSLIEKKLLSAIDK